MVDAAPFLPTSGSRAYRRFRLETVTNEASPKSGEGLGAALLEKRRRKKAMFVSRKPTQVVEVESKGIEQFASEGDLDFKLSGSCICALVEPEGAICATMFVSNGGRCAALEEELQKLRRQDKLRIVCHLP
jgi:hypothetical protein